MNERIDRKLVFFLPNIFTALNMACGFIAIMMALQGEFYKSCMLIILGAVFDSVDGRVARLVGATSAFGEQFDSMSDLVSFGMAPALIYYHRFLQGSGRPGLVLCFLFILCGALRLARFNANIEKVDSNYFQGLPIPGAAMGIIGGILLSLEFKVELIEPIVLGYIFIYSVLMISNFPFPSFKQSSWVKNHKKQVLMVIFVLFLLLSIYEEMMIPSLITAYVLISLIYYLFNRKKFKGPLEWEADH